MPYKRIGRTVYVKRGKVWRKLKTHRTVREAKKHLIALNINVRRRERR